MAFKATGSTQTSGGDRKQVDYNAMNLEVVEAAGTQNKTRSIPGVISGIYDLGEQALDDAAIPVTDPEWLKRNPSFDGSDAAKEAIIAAARQSNARFEEFDGVECFRYEQKPVQQVAVTVDFAQIMVDKGKHYGESKPLPLRLLLNREFNKVVSHPYNIREMNHNQGKPGKAVWAFAKNNGLHKLAEAVGILDEQGLFKKERIDELLGKVAQFQVRVYMKENKGKSFYTEEVRLAGIVPEGVPHPVLPDDVVLASVGMWDEGNDKDAVLQARASIKNTQRKALNFVDPETGADSPVKALIGEGYNPDAPKEDEAPKAKPQGITPKAPEPDADFEDDIPF
jgi:hypothetical protein